MHQWLKYKNKYTPLLLLLFAVVIVSCPREVYAIDAVNAAASGVFESVFKGLIYGFFVVCGWLTGVAMTLLDWAITPGFYSGNTGFLNKESVYNTWKFIRDFFNLFFILVLLYIAFTVVFQIQKNFKQALLSLVLAALFVNFSFPISRVLIDATNVPMYFFANQITNKGDISSGLGAIFEASQIKGILIYGDGTRVTDTSVIGDSSVTVSRLLTATIFLFIFSITLLVLAVLFIIRLIALVVLVIFSSVGFAAAVIPGMKSYSDMWWDSFWKYALFGPAAMLMLLVSTRFFVEIGHDTTYSSLKQVGQQLSSVNEAGFISSMAMFSIPIVMLWMTIGLGQKFSIAGAASISGKGEKFAKWVGSKTYNNPVGRGLGGAGKKMLNEGKIAGVNYGATRFGKWATGDFWASPSKTEAVVKGFVSGGRTGVTDGLSSLHQQEVRKQVEEHKKNKTSHSDLRNDLRSTDKAKSQSAALALAQNDDIRDTQELTDGLAALAGDAEMTNEFVKKGQSAIQSVGDFTTALAALGNDSKAAATLIEKVGGGAVGMNQAEYAALTASSLFQGNPNLQKQLDGRLKKDGHVQTLVDHAAAQPGGSYDAAYANLVADMSPAELAKQRDSLHNSPEFVAYVQGHSGANDTFSDEHRKNVFGELSGKKKSFWATNGIQP